MFKKVKYGINKLFATLALLSLELIIVLVAFFSSLLLVSYIVRRVFLLNKTDLDFTVFNYLSRFVSTSTTKFMQAVTIFGSHYFLIPANLLLIAYFLFIKKHKWHSIRIPAVALTSLLLMFTLKFFFNRPRPLIPLLHKVGGLSFPSGHAFMSFSFYGLLIFLCWKYIHNKTLKWAMIAALFFFILLIGTSRVYLRVHYASDVVAGFCLGLMWLVLSLWILRKIEKRSLQKAALKVAAKMDTQIAGGE